MVQAAIGGQVITQVFEGEKHFDLILRWAEPYRRDTRSIRNILVSTPDGSQVLMAYLRDNALGIMRQMEELDEEHGGEDGLLADAKNDKAEGERGKGHRGRGLGLFSRAGRSNGS